MRKGQDYHIYDIVEKVTGKTRKEFCRSELNCNYQTFHHRYVEGKIHVKDFIYLALRTGKSLDELIMQDPKYADLIKTLKTDPSVAFSRPEKPKGEKPKEKKRVEFIPV